MRCTDTEPCPRGSVVLIETKTCVIPSSQWLPSSETYASELGSEVVEYRASSHLSSEDPQMAACLELTQNDLVSLSGHISFMADGDPNRVMSGHRLKTILPLWTECVRCGTTNRFYASEEEWSWFQWNHAV